MSNSAMSPNHDEMRKLIPWFLNGTLTEDEASLIRAHLENCPDCNADVVVHERMRTAVIQNDATPIVPSASADSLLDGLTQREPRQKIFTQQRKFAAAAIIAVMLITAVSFRANFGPSEQNGTFQTATQAGSESGMGYVLRLRFESEISPEQRNRVMQELGGTDIRGLEDSQMYEMLVHLPTASLGELERFADEARTRTEIRTAEFVALQLPVR